ncbi:MAG TPA: 5,10-methylenetetrahydrofolate reductase, partial [Candidatus Dormibacteraeota bacterium]|nr:5,10-methylenetetrahydrofolate reductase [Candidatus Dormibacteraeota bacterium]
MVRAVGARGETSSLASFLRHARYEILPTEGVLDLVVAHVPKDVTLTVTASPRRGLPATVHLAVRLAQLGYRAIPHLSARLIRDVHELGQ